MLQNVMKMQRLFLIIAFIFAWICVYAQTPLYTTGFTFCNGVPTHNPGTNGAKYAIDTVTFNLYVRSYGTSWTLIGQGGNWIQNISGCSAPAYTPTKFQSKIVINACNPAEVYAWDGSAWDKIAPSSGGISGSGLATRIAAWTASGTLGYDVNMVLDTVNNRMGVNTAAPGRTLDVDGEARIRDLTTTTPTVLVAADANGVFSSATVGTGLSLSGGTLSSTATGTVTGTGLANKLTIWNSSTNAGYALPFSVDTTNRRLSLGTASQVGQLAFTDTTSTRALITLDGVRYIHTIGQGTISEGSQFWGYQAGPANPVSSSFRSNFGFGYQAGAALVSGAEYNMFIGNSTGRLYAGTDDFMTIIGNNAFQSATSGCANCTVIGRGSMINATAPGNENTSVGAGTIAASGFTGGFNTVMGRGAMSSNSLTSADFNVAIGRTSMSALTTGDNNTSLGAGSGGQLTTGGNNVLIGYNAANGNQTGDQNVIIGRGRDAADMGTDVDNSVMIGYQAGSAETGDNKLYIDNSSTSTPLIGGDFSSNFIGINTPISGIDAALEVTGTGATSSTMGLDVSNSNDSIIIAARNDRRVGINTATPDVSLDAGDNTDGIKIPAGTTAQEPAVNNTIRINTTREAFEVRENGVQFRLTSSKTPTIAAGAAAGTGPTIAVAGNDLSGKITLTVGTSPTTGALCTVTFGSTMDAATTNYVTFSAADKDAANAITSFYVSAESNTSFTISVDPALTAGTEYIINYAVGQ